MPAPNVDRQVRAILTIIGALVIAGVVAIVLALAGCQREQVEDAYDSPQMRARRITIHVLAPGICVALYREQNGNEGAHDEVAAAITSIPCPPPESPK